MGGYSRDCYGKIVDSEDSPTVRQPCGVTEGRTAALLAIGRHCASFQKRIAGEVGTRHPLAGYADAALQARRWNPANGRLGVYYYEPYDDVPTWGFSSLSGSTGWTSMDDYCQAWL